METLHQTDIFLFRWVNNLAGQNELLDWFFYFCAVYLIFVLVGLAAALVIYYFLRETNYGFVRILRIVTPSNSPLCKGEKKKVSPLKVRGDKGGLPKFFQFLFLLVLTPVLAYFLKIIINLVYFRPRPFVVLDNVHQLIFKSPLDASFPSGHAVIAFALAFVVFYKNKIWGSVFLVLAILIGFGRIFVGVHYPLDIIAGIIVAFFSVLFIKLIIKRCFLYGK